MFTHDFSPLVLALFLVAAHFPAYGRYGLRITLATLMVLFWLPPVYFLLVAWHSMYPMFVPLLAFALAATYLARHPHAGITPESGQPVGAIGS